MQYALNAHAARVLTSALAIRCCARFTSLDLGLIHVRSPLTCKPEAVGALLAANGQPDAFALYSGSDILFYLGTDSRIFPGFTPPPHTPCGALFSVSSLVCAARRRVSLLSHTHARARSLFHLYLSLSSVWSVPLPLPANSTRFAVLQQLWSSLSLFLSFILCVCVSLAIYSLSDTRDTHARSLSFLSLPLSLSLSRARAHVLSFSLARSISPPCRCPRCAVALYISSHTHARTRAHSLFFISLSSPCSCLGAPGAPGVLSLGGADPELFAGDMAYVPVTDSYGHYAVNLQAIGIDGKEQCSGVCHF